MGIDINLWRARIGCFNPKGKQVGMKIEKIRGLRLTLVGIPRSFLFLSLLITMSGDVEANPGPIFDTVEFPFKGEIHQGSEVFGPSTRGKQCMACCISFFLKLKWLQSDSEGRCQNWKNEYLTEVLYSGDLIYQQCIQNMRCQNSYLLPSDLPSLVEMQNKYFSLKKKKTYSGNIREGFIGEYPLVNLEVGLNLAFSNDCFAIFVCKGNAVGVYIENGSFIVFDSHARNDQGMCDANGASVLLRYEHFMSLCNYFRLLIHSLTCTNLPLNEQFDIHSFKIDELSKHVAKRHLSNSHIFSCILTSVNPCLLERIQYTKESKPKQPPYSTAPKIVLIDLPFLVSVDQSYQIKGQRQIQPKCQHTSPANSDADIGLKKKLKTSHDLAVIEEFKKSVSGAPEFVCTSCSQLFFQHSVRSFRLTNMPSEFIQACTVGHKSVNDKEWICNDCFEHLRKGQIPPVSKGNGLTFPVIPQELKDLTPLEERLISPRIPFMQIHELPRGGQHCIKGNVVNVPADVNTTIKELPRNMDNCETIPLKLKRSKLHSSSILYEQIRPQKVIEACKWLVENSLLFQKEGIVINNEWMHSPSFTGSNEHLDKVSSIPDKESSTSNSTSHASNIENIEVHGINSESDESSCNGWTEKSEMCHMVGQLDTVMQPADFREFNRILTLAPGEGNVPLGMFQDKFAEFLSFPSIYCGTTREDNNTRKVPLHYSTICKWELRNSDRRVARNVSNIFFKLKKLQIKQITGKVSLAVRKCKLQGKNVTAGDMLCKEKVNNILKLNEGYRVLRTLRSSPPYWEQAKKDIFSMVRQLGTPTWFCSFSAAETKWLDLLKSLGKVVFGRIYSNEEVRNMAWQDKCNLIKSDPTQCVRYFDRRVQLFLTKVLRHKSNPIGLIDDFFYRVEFQQRGSPHIHMLIWIKDAPNLDSNSVEEVVTFLDQYVTCYKDPNMTDLINYQTHRHAVTCRKKGQSVCRFGFPLPPMDKTCVLNGLDSRSSTESKNNFDKIMKYLESLKLSEHTSISFKEFLQSMRLSYDEYIAALRSSIKPGMSKIFLKRSLSEIRINNYNSTLLKCWEANMDIQYILDPYACAAYIASYISKGQRGMSNLLSRACREAREVGSDIKEQVRKVGNVFLNHVEIGAQEAVYLILQLPLRRASRSVVYINTRPPEERVALIKSADNLKDLPPTSTSIEADNDIKRYQRRPATMESYTLADFVACFEVKFPPKKCKSSTNDFSATDELPEKDYEEDTLDDDNENSCNFENSVHREEHVGRDGSVIVRRSKPRVICSVGYDIVQQRENHFREMIMLYTNWRNENDLLDSSFHSYEQMFNQVKDSIMRNMKKYVNDQSKDIANIPIDEIEFDENISTCTESQHQNEQDEIQGTSTCDLFQCFDPGKGEDHRYDLAQDLGIGCKQLDVEILQNEMTDNEYRQTVQQLNLKQRQYFYHVLHWHKSFTKPMYSFLSGGAGVGKSVLLRVIYQSLKKFYRFQVGENPDTCKVLVCAPTGKAAYNVTGLTIHSAFNIPVEQGFNYKPLDMQQLGNFQTKYGRLKVLIIDEISMVGKKMFNFINKRLQEIKGNLLPFGGVSVLAFGDLFQLKPVFDSWIFSNSGSSHDLDILASNLWIDHFKLYELDQIMRQKDDIHFAQLLNRLREGNHTESDVDCLKGKIIQNEHNTENISSIPHLYTKRIEVENHNKLVYNKCQVGKKTVVTAIDSLSGEFSEALKQKILSKLPEDSTKTKSLSKFLHIAENVPAELCCNIDVLDGLTNGTPCLVRKLDYRVPNSQRCSIIWVEFEDSHIGLKLRSAFRHLYNSSVNSEWTPILETSKKFQFNYYKPFLITRRQFPLTLSAAKTVHKSQGSTMSEAVIHFGNRKNDHMHYVALSRVQNLANVQIIALNEKNISVSEAVMDEMLRLRETACVELCVQEIICSRTTYNILFHNCRSLHKHIHDIRKESFVSNADVIALCETRLHHQLDANMYQIPGFALWRHDQKVVRGELPHHGSAIYSRKDIRFFSTHVFEEVEITQGILTLGTMEVQLCIVYCPPKNATLSNLTNLFKFLSEILEICKPLIVMGDLNYDILSKSHQLEYLKSMPGTVQLVSQVTTDYSTLLDHVYTNIPNTCISDFGTLESYYSDHKPVFLSVKVMES